MGSAITSALVLVAFILLLSFVGNVELNQIIESTRQFIAANGGLGLGLIVTVVVLLALRVVAHPPQWH